MIHIPATTHKIAHASTDGIHCHNRSGIERLSRGIAGLDQQKLQAGKLCFFAGGHYRAHYHAEDHGALLRRASGASPPTRTPPPARRARRGHGG